MTYSSKIDEYNKTVHGIEEGLHGAGEQAGGD